MRKSILITASALLFAVFVQAGGVGDKVTYNINSQQSKVVWLGEKVTGEHTGTIDIASGTLTMVKDKVAAASIQMDMNSIKNTDLTDAGYNAKLVGHLKSDDFFAVTKFPTASFEATSFAPIAAAKTGEANYTVKGKLTIKGTTEVVSFPAIVTVKGDKVLAKGTLTFDRSKFNVRYGSSSFFESLGDKVIYDDVELKFNLVAETVTVN